jgi:hypothetical protein
VLEAGIEAIAPLLRYTFRVEGLPGTVYQEPLVAGLGFVGLGVSFP